MEALKAPDPLRLEGNIADNWKKWKQKFELYMTATGIQGKAQKVQRSTLLHIIGDDALEIYNTFEFTQQEDRIKLKVLLEKFEEHFTPHRNVAFERHVFNTRVQAPDLRIVMLGKTGAGKSATGNTILGQNTEEAENVFKEDMSSQSVTNECQKEQKKIDGLNISVIDTPGRCDTSLSKEQLKKEIVKCVYMSAPGPHAFLLVIRLDDRFTKEQQDAVKWIQENFGEEAARYTIILFTRGDQLRTPIKEFLTKNKQMNELVEQCNDRYHVFDNTDENRSQVVELLKKIESMVNENGGEHYTNEMYKEAQKKLMLKKAQDAALVGASVAGVGAAVAGGAVLVAATGGVALPVALLAGGAALTGGTGAAKAIADQVKHVKGKVKK